MQTPKTPLSVGDPTSGARSGAVTESYPSVPTTRILAIGRLHATLTAEQKKSVLPKEVPATLKLFLEGGIDQWWYRQDGKGPVFLLNVHSVQEARELISTLPLAVAGLMECDFIELGPLRPLYLLLSEGWANSKA